MVRGAREMREKEAGIILYRFVDHVPYVREYLGFRIAVEVSAGRILGIYMYMQKCNMQNASLTRNS